MLDRDEVRPSDSCNADRNSEVSRSLSFVICCRWIVNTSRGRQNGDQKYSEDNDRPTQVLHGKNPKLPETILPVGLPCQRKRTESRRCPAVLECLESSVALGAERETEEVKGGE